MRPASTPTRLLPAPTSANSASVTLCRRPAGSVGSTVRAKSVLSVLAGGSLRCALCAASTSPVPASATSHDRADTSRGSRGEPARSRAWVPERYSSRASVGVGVAVGVAGTVPVPLRADAGTGASASTPVTDSAQQEAAIRDENLMVIPQT